MTGPKGYNKEGSIRINKCGVASDEWNLSGTRYNTIAFQEIEGVK